MPFHNVRDTEVVYKVIQGERPVIPANASEVGISEGLWQLLVKCWNHSCTERPEINEILQHLSQEPALGLIFPHLNLPLAPSCESIFVSATQKYGNSLCFVLVSSRAYSSIADMFVTASVSTPTDGTSGDILWTTGLNTFFPTRIPTVPDASESRRHVRGLQQ
jgi:hypothetical protein